MEIYLLKSVACLGLFFAFYKLVLERTSIHNFKRFYLFGSLLASFFIPMITFTTYVEPTVFVPVYTAGTPQLAQYETVETINYWPFVLWTVYGLGVLFFSVKFFRNLFSLIQKIRLNPKYRNNNFINILLSEAVIPHTFFSYIFLNKQQFEKDEIPAEVMLHEETHAIQKHSLDVIFVELLQIVFWFNPLFHYIKRSIKLNHEFLADEAVLNAGTETSEYQKILLAFSSNAFTPALAHSINYSSIKKRFTVMKTHTSKRAVWLRSLLLLPLLSVMIYGFSTKETVEKNPLSNYISTNDTIEDIHIKIDINSTISLNGKTVALSSLKDEINKLNTNLSAEQRQKYLSANIDIENDNVKSVAEKVGEILYASNIRSWSVISLKSGNDAGLKHIPQNNPMAGKTIAEAEILYQQHLKELEKFKTAKANAKKDENNPWSVQVGEPVERDEATGKIIHQKATKAEIAEYNNFAKKYNAIPIEERIIQLNDLKELETIYRKMDEEQKASATPFPECPKMTARSLDIKILNNGFYNINGLIATKETLIKTVENFNQDISPALRKKIVNIHVQSKNKITNEEISFLYYALQGYGFFRMVAPNQEIVPSKGNTPFLKMSENAEVQDEYEKWYVNTINNFSKVKATPEEIAEYNKLAKKYNAVDIEKRIIKKNDLERLETIYKKMTDEQKADAELFPECIPPPPPPAPPTPTLTNKGTTLNLSRSKKTGFHFNTSKRTNTPLYYYKNKLIPINKVSKLLNENKALKMYVSETNDAHGTVTLSEKPVLGKKELLPPPPPEAPKTPSAENGNLYTAPQAPPPPNSDPVEYIKELAKRGAIFYIGPHKYNAEEAIKMVKKSTNEVTIDVSKYPDVHLGGC